MEGGREGKKGRGGERGKRNNENRKSKSRSLNKAEIAKYEIRNKNEILKSEKGNSKL